MSGWGFLSRRIQTGVAPDAPGAVHHGRTSACYNKPWVGPTLDLGAATRRQVAGHVSLTETLKFMWAAPVLVKPSSNGRGILLAGQLQHPAQHPATACAGLERGAGRYGRILPKPSVGRWGMYCGTS